MANVSPEIHSLKTLPQYFSRVASGHKTFELRKNDRGFRVGDYLLLEEYFLGSDSYSGSKIIARISDILSLSEFVKVPPDENWVILSMIDIAVHIVD